MRDELLPVRSLGERYAVRLHWLLKDGVWEAGSQDCKVNYGAITLKVSVGWKGGKFTGLRLVRAGRVQVGEEENFDCFGWYSPTYLSRLPALSLVFDFSLQLPAELITRFEISASKS